MGHAICLTGLSLFRPRGDREMSEDKGLSAPVASAPTRRVFQGPVMPIGGAEETEPGGGILERFIELAGGKRAQIAIIPTASDDPQRSGEGYAELFRDLGAKKADWLRVEQRSDANTEEPLSLLRDATGMFITGGDQTRLVEFLVGTLVMECIRTRNAEGFRRRDQRRRLKSPEPMQSGGAHQG